MTKVPSKSRMCNWRNIHYETPMRRTYEYNYGNKGRIIEKEGSWKQRVVEHLRLNK